MRMEAWRDGQSYWGRGCGCVMFLGISLVGMGVAFGPLIGDYIGPPERLEEHSRSMMVQFGYGFCFLTLCVGAGLWWARGIDVGRKGP